MIPVLEREREGYTARETCTNLALCAESKPGVLCPMEDRTGVQTDTDELELQVNGSQNQAASDGRLPQPRSVAAASNTSVEEYSMP